MVLYHKIKTKTSTMNKMLSIADNGNWLSLPDSELISMNNSLCFRYRVENAVKLTNRLARLAQNTKDDWNLQFLCANDKTGDSIDVTTKCIFMCQYCYCNNPYIKAKMQYWSIDDLYLTPTRQNAFRNYLLRRKDLVKGYPLRFGSLADFPSSHFGLVRKLLDICNETDTKTIFITKNKDIIPIVYNAATVVLYSVDTGKYNSPSSLETYCNLSERFPKLRMFSMVVDFTELRWFYEKIVTYNIPLEKIQFVAFHGQITDTEKNKSPITSQLNCLLKPEMLQLLTGRACCVNGRCLSCSLLCGINQTSVTKFTFKPFKYPKKGVI